MRTQKSRPVQVLFAFALLATALGSAQVTPWNQVKIPPLAAFQPQQPTRIQLANGMVIFL